MKKRVIFGIIGALIAIPVLWLTFTPYIDVLVFVSSLAAVFELMKTFGVKNKLLYAASLSFAALTVCYHAYAPLLDAKIPLFVIVSAYFMLLLIIMIFDFGNTRFDHAALSAFVSIALPSALACFLKFKNLATVYHFVSRGHVRYLVWFCLCSSVLTDTFALFTGVKFGKHKLCPNISPKKTVEGAVGGVIGSVIFNIVPLVFLNKVVFQESFPVGYLGMTVLAIAASVISMFGDLAASCVKRNYGVKDFGHIMPGHGGIMDRMDSISFSTPLVYGCMYVMFLCS